MHKILHLQKLMHEILHVQKLMYARAHIHTLAQLCHRMETDIENGIIFRCQTAAELTLTLRSHLKLHAHPRELVSTQPQSTPPVFPQLEIASVTTTWPACRAHEPIV